MALINLKRLINTPTFFQSEKPPIDLILTNSFFKNSKTFEVAIVNIFRATQRLSSTEAINLLSLNQLIMN